MGVTPVHSAHRLALRVHFIAWQLAASAMQIPCCSPGHVSLRPDRTAQDKTIPGNDQQKTVFTNAWNEWAESCHLEPCRKWGLRCIEATRRVYLGEKSRDSLGSV